MMVVETDEPVIESDVAVVVVSRVFSEYVSLLLCPSVSVSSLKSPWMGF